MEKDIKEYRQPKSDIFIVGVLTAIGCILIGYFLGKKVDVSFKYFVYILASSLWAYNFFKQFLLSRNYFQLEGKTLRYFKQNRLKLEVDVTKCEINYYITGNKKAPKYILEIVNNGRLEKLECSHFDGKVLYDDIVKVKKSHIA